MINEQCEGFLSTPPLWENTQFGITQFEFPNIEMDSFHPQAIPQNIRLGHQMEYVFKQLVEHSKNYEVLLHSLPIRHDKQTMGEIDFILKDLQSQYLIHVELTYKFYIINPEISEPIHRLMGPNRRDMFFTKIEKIKNEQFPLLHDTEGSKALAELDIDATEIIHQTCYKGQLFQPYHQTNTSIRPLNKGCIVGHWLRFEAFNSAAFKENQFYIPYKLQWVIAPHNDVAWQSHFEITMEINLRMIKENAPMVWMKKSDATFEKFFVVWW